MSQNNTVLTQDELLHLAVEATRRGEHGAAISYLKEGVSRFPSDGKLAYVLGAEFAQIGMYEQAEIEMSRAITLAPELHTASFQLGLLQLTLGKLTEAKSTWSRLDILPSDNALFLFKSGLEYLAGEQYAEAQSLLEQGLVANNFSPELNNDMQNILASMPQATLSSSVDNTEASTEHVWLSAYNTDDSKKLN